MFNLATLIQMEVRYQKWSGLRRTMQTPLDREIYIELCATGNLCINDLDR